MVSIYVKACNHGTTYISIQYIADVHANIQQRFQLLNIHLHHQLQQFQQRLFLITASLTTQPAHEQIDYIWAQLHCVPFNGLLYVYFRSHSNCISSCTLLQPAYVSTNCDTACIAIQYNGIHNSSITIIALKHRTHPSKQFTAKAQLYYI